MPKHDRKFKCVADAVIYIMDRIAVSANGCWEMDSVDYFIGNPSSLYAAISGCVRIQGKEERSAHRIMFLAHKKLPQGMVVRHTCNNSMCVNPKHLIAGTKKENHYDMVISGRHPIWETGGKINHNWRPDHADTVEINKDVKINRRGW